MRRFFFVLAVVLATAGCAGTPQVTHTGETGDDTVLVTLSEGEYRIDADVPREAREDFFLQVRGPALPGESTGCWTVLDWGDISRPEDAGVLSRLVVDDEFCPSGEHEVIVHDSLGVNDLYGVEWTLRFVLLDS